MINGGNCFKTNETGRSGDGYEVENSSADNQIYEY